MTILERIAYNAIFGRKKKPEYEDKLKWGKISALPPNEDQLILGEGVYSDLWKESRLRPNNTLVIGGAGSGKNRCYIEPNLVSGNTNYVIVDRGGEVQSKYAWILKEAGFDVKSVDACFQSEDCVNFNPFTYLETEADICCMAEVLAESCYNERGARDPFYDKLTEQVLRSLVCYVKDSLPEREQSLFGLCKIFSEKICVENNGSFKLNMVENYLALMEEYCEKFSVGFGESCYRIVREASTRLSLENALADLAIVVFPWIKAMYNDRAHLAGQDGVELTSFRDKKSVLFLNMSVSDCTYDSYYEFFLWQAYKICMKENTDDKRAVHFILNEFASYRVPELCAFLAGGRNCGIFTSIVVQCLEQLKRTAGDTFDNTLLNCDNILYLGGNDCATCEFISNLLGKTVVQKIAGKEFAPGTRYLMVPDELRRIPTKDCIVIRRDENPYYTTKFDVSKHPNYKEEK